ncbi:PucR family transcriptional regulator [Terrilactibacillus laevilacticus]|uniref:PucR family transcriptional regulator n=1 Tax=Terrilactibacillus laevilacticus TaxID=1380157 RepID=A0ABW5PN69_9BACI|nr:PucR family transcriptional regulator [Terrilactibacillus laevilacticus]
MKVADLLHIPAFKNFEIVAGKTGLNRDINNINMMDAPDIIDYLKSDDLLVTSGYHLRGDPQFFVLLVKNMARLGCSAIGIKTERFLYGIPQEVCELADKLKFPIINIPTEIPLVEVVNETLSLLRDNRLKELKFAIDAHEQFTIHIMNGKGVQKLLENLSNIIKLPLLLLDPYFRPLIPKKLSGENHKIIQSCALIKNDFFLETSNYTSFSLTDPRCTLTIFPVYTAGNKQCYLIALGEISYFDRLLILTLEQAVNVIAFELMKEDALKQNDRKIKQLFFMNLINNAFSSEKEITHRAKEFHLKTDQKYVCIAGQLDMPDQTSSFIQYQMETNTIYEYMEDEVNSFPFASHFFIEGQQCMILLEIEDSVSHSYEQVSPYLNQLQNKIQHFFNQSISFGLSTICHQLMDVHAIYKEALDALDTGRRMGKTNFIEGYEVKDIADMLRMIPVEDLKAFYKNTLQHLFQYPKDEAETLLHTLFVFLESHCQISETAKKLFVHRNTVIYRLEKCETVFGWDLKDPDTTFRLRLAMRIRPLLNLS